jgi:hypothetical protein
VDLFCKINKSHLKNELDESNLLFLAVKKLYKADDAE